MASHQQQAGQGSDSSNQLQMKKDECVNKCNDAASDVSGQAQMKREEYGNKASETASHASNTAETKGREAANEAGGTKDGLMHDATESAKDNSTVQAAQTYAIELKDQASTLLQHTGEQVKNIAAGAAESIKSTWSGINTTTDNNTTTGSNTNNAAAASGGANNADTPLINHNQLSSNSDRRK